MHSTLGYFQMINYLGPWVIDKVQHSPQHTAAHSSSRARGYNSKGGHCVAVVNPPPLLQRPCNVFAHAPTFLSHFRLK